MSDVSASGARGPLRGSLATNVTLFCLGCAFLVAAILTWRSYHLAAQGLREQAEFSLSADARQVSSAIDGWNEQRLRDLRALAKLPAVVRMFQQSPPGASDLRDATDAISTIASTVPDVESIALVDRSGTLLLNSNTEDGKSGVSNLKIRDYFQAAIAGSEFISGITVSVLSHKPSLFHSVPVRAPDGSIVGIVRSRASLDGVMAVVQEAAGRVGKNSTGVLLDADGLVIATSAGDDWLLRPVVPISAARVGELIKEKRWANGKAPKPLGESDLGAAVGILEPKLLAWKSLSGVAYHALATPLKDTAWVYLDALPVSSFEARADELRDGSLLWGVVLLIVIAPIQALAARRMMRPISELTDATTRIVKDGDLTQKIEITSKDEVGRLASSFSQMVTRLRELPQALHASSELLTNASHRLEQASSEQSETISRQATALQETQVTAQELKQTALVAAEKAKAVLDFAERADELGRKGQGAIEQSLAGLDGIREHVYEIGRRISKLETRTQQIGTITATVKDLADQSNMLALNAAIEAVRSGEHGKGFGVVAREIRNLADQSIAATKRVAEILEEITHAIRETQSFADEGTKRMETGVSSVKTSGDSLNELSTIVRSNVGAVRQIASAVNQQSAGISQIFTAVSDQSDLMNENQRRMEETSHAAQELKKASHQVQTISSSYKV